MDFPDPFYGYSFVLKALLFAGVPAFTVWQFVRLRRALHVFQLEGYKRSRFLEWCRGGGRALFLRRPTHKKPLVMTGRAWRILATATVLSGAGLAGATFAAHLWAGGWPADVVAWVGAAGALWFGMPYVLVAADALLTPVQVAVNARYRGAASRRLAALAPTVIGVTGSFGKTSTKFAVAHLLGGPGVAAATPGSYNTPMGIVRAVNEGLEDFHQFFVVEMGAYHEGEIAELCAFARPRIGVLTAIGPAHLERFGSIEAVARAKYEIVESLPADGTAVMNVDDPRVRELADTTTAVRVVRYGLDPIGVPDVTAADVAVTHDGTSFTIRSGDTSLPAHTRLLGPHAVGHVLAAVGVAGAAGVPLDEVAARIASLEPVPHRLQLIKGEGGVTVIDDAFNSNPDGAAAALDVLAAMPGTRKVVVTPGIVELGLLQEEANRRLGEHAARVADVVIFVAPINREPLMAGAESAASGADVMTVDSLDDATARLRTLLRPGDVVLFENDLPDHLEV